MQKPWLKSYPPGVPTDIDPKAYGSLVDLLDDGLSLVYSFYDPELSGQSLGAYIILDHIEQAKALGSPYVYLGYWVAGSPKMAYKAKYSPLEILRPGGWRLISAQERDACRPGE